MRQRTKLSSSGAFLSICAHTHHAYAHTPVNTRRNIHTHTKYASMYDNPHDLNTHAFLERTRMPKRTHTCPHTLTLSLSHAFKHTHAHKHAHTNLSAIFELSQKLQSTWVGSGPSSFTDGRLKRWHQFKMLREIYTNILCSPRKISDVKNLHMCHRFNRSQNYLDR